MVGDRFWFLARFAFGPEWDVVSMPAALCCGVCASLICHRRPKPRVSFPSSLVQSIPLWSSVQFSCYHLSIFPGCQCPSLVPQWRIQPSSESNPLPFLTAICQVLSKASPCLCSCFFQHYYWMLFLFALRLCCTGPTQTCGCWLAVSLHWALPIAIGLIEMSGRIPSTFVSSLSVGILVSSGRWS